MCPGLRPLLKGLAGAGTSTPEALDSQPPPPPPAAEPPTEGPSSHEGLGGGSSSDVTTAAAEVEASSFSERDADAGGADSVLDYGGDGSLVVAEARGGGDQSSSPANDELQAADGLFEDKGAAAGGERDAAAGAREVFDRPVVQSSPAPPILSGGRPQIV